MAFKIEELIQPPEHMRRCMEFVHQVDLLAEQMAGRVMFITENETEDHLRGANFSSMPPEIQKLINRNPAAKEHFLKYRKFLADEADMQSINEATALVSLVAEGTDDVDELRVIAAAFKVTEIAETLGGQTFTLADPSDLVESPFGNIYGSDGKKVTLRTEQDEEFDEGAYSIDLHVHFYAK